MNWMLWMVAGGLFAALVFGLAESRSQQRECETRGGVYVRQAFGFACVSALPMKK